MNNFWKELALRGNLALKNEGGREADEDERGDSGLRDLVTPGLVERDPEKAKRILIAMQKIKRLRKLGL